MRNPFHRHRFEPTNFDFEAIKTENGSTLLWFFPQGRPNIITLTEAELPINDGAYHFEMCRCGAWRFSDCEHA